MKLISSNEITFTAWNLFLVGVAISSSIAGNGRPLGRPEWRACVISWSHTAIASKLTPTGTSAHKKRRFVQGLGMTGKMPGIEKTCP